MCIKDDELGRELIHTPSSNSCRTTTPQTFALYYNTAISQPIRFSEILIIEMFMAYHEIKFAVLLIGGAGVIFQASSVEESLARNPVRVKTTESKFNLNTY